MIDQAAPRTRRAVLAATLAAAGAAVASMVGRPLATRAEGEAIVVGGEYDTATSVTRLRNNVNDANVLVGRSERDGTGVSGISNTGFGTNGSANSGIGVVGTSVTGFGVYASSNKGVSLKALGAFNTAINGESHQDGVAAVVAHTTGDGTGLLGYAGPTPLPNAQADTGVMGIARGSGGRGVFGFVAAGRGVVGQTSSGVGVHAVAKTGVALRASGRVRLDDCAGLATIKAGTKSVTVAPGIALGPDTAVVATLQGSAGGLTTVHRVTVDPAADTFTIHLTANAAGDVRVAWHLFG